MKSDDIDIKPRPTVWKLWECPAGNRWSSSANWLDCTGEVCTYSGCDCRGVVKCVSATESREVAANWSERVTDIHNKGKQSEEE